MCLPSSINIQLPLSKLTKKEMEDPELVFSQFFEYTDLEDAKKTLSVICKKITKRKSFFRTRNKKEDDTLFFMEKIERLIEAAYLMR
jgi:hypothetical protein